MRRIVAVLLVVVAFVGLLGTDRVSLGTAAQDAATPAAGALAEGWLPQSFCTDLWDSGPTTNKYLII